jgi:hypothetical protein
MLVSVTPRGILGLVSISLFSHVPVVALGQGNAVVSDSIPYINTVLSSAVLLHLTISYATASSGKFFILNLTPIALPINSYVIELVRSPFTNYM